MRVTVALASLILFGAGWALTSVVAQGCSGLILTGKIHPSSKRQILAGQGQAKIAIKVRSKQTVEDLNVKVALPAGLSVKRTASRRRSGSPVIVSNIDGTTAIYWTKFNLTHKHLFRVKVGVENCASEALAVRVLAYVLNATDSATECSQSLANPLNLRIRYPASQKYGLGKKKQKMPMTCAPTPAPTTNPSAPFVPFGVGQRCLEASRLAPFEDRRLKGQEDTIKISEDSKVDDKINRPLGLVAIQTPFDCYTYCSLNGGESAPFFFNWNTATTQCFCCGGQCTLILDPEFDTFQVLIPATAAPTVAPSRGPAPVPTSSPTATPSQGPSIGPTTLPSALPTVLPTISPTFNPTAAPSEAPTDNPTASPTLSPTAAPTLSPTASPTAVPTASPTPSPTAAPTLSPTASPTTAPTASPTPSPTAAPTLSPTASPTAAPSASPTPSPTAAPSMAPTIICYNGEARVVMADGQYKPVIALHKGDLVSVDPLRPHVHAKVLSLVEAPIEEGRGSPMCELAPGFFLSNLHPIRMNGTRWIRPEWEFHCSTRKYLSSLFNIILEEGVHHSVNIEGFAVATWVKYPVGVPMIDRPYKLEMYRLVEASPDFSAGLVKIDTKEMLKLKMAWLEANPMAMAMERFYTTSPVGSSHTEL